MTRRSVVDYLENFLRRGGECAYVQHRGYRTVRWSYRQVAEAAFQCARELQERAILLALQCDVGQDHPQGRWRCASHVMAHGHLRLSSP